MSTISASGPAGMPLRTSDRVRLYLGALAIVLVAELIGNVSIPIGSAKLVLLPLLWALLIGAAWGLAIRIDRQPPLQCCLHLDRNSKV